MKTEGCEECLASGGRWVHLRVCLSCGHVGCCDSSPNRHASAHFQKTRHPLMRSAQPDEDWGWCYEDEEMLRGDELPRATRPLPAETAHP